MFGIGLCVGWLTSDVVFKSAAQQATVSPPIPVPLPIGMGGTGTAVGPTIGQSTVGTLPACSVSNKGQVLFVTDALAPVLGVSIVAGGAVNVMVFCNGASWIAG